MASLSIEQIAAILNEYEDDAEGFAEDSQDADEMILWTAQASAVRQVRKLLFEAAGLVDPRAEQDAKREKELVEAIDEVFR